MNEPPKMLSTKDILYFSDILNVTGTYIKKFKHYDDLISCKEMKTLVLTITKELTSQYSVLLKELKNG